MDETKNVTDAAEVADAEPKRKSLGRRIARWAMWVVLTPILLVLLLMVLIYIPPVQKWAVDRASEWLSAETGMEVSVENVRLAFPLDLSMGGMLAVEDGDTVLHAERLDVSIGLMPLFRGVVNVDAATLEGVKVNTRQMIDAALVKGSVGHVSVDAHGIDLGRSLMRFDHVRLSDADLYVALADSVPEDTTESEPSTWKIALDDVLIERVRLRLLLSPQADSTLIGLNVGRAALKGLLNLPEETYTLNDIDIQQTTFTYDVGSAMPIDGFDSQHVRVDEFGTRISRLRYAALGGMNVDIDSLQGKERGGWQLTRGRGRIALTPSGLDLKQLQLQTPNSDLRADFHMDMTAFDVPTDSTPYFGTGTFDAEVCGFFGMADALPMMGGDRAALPANMPMMKTAFDVKSSGNLQSLYIESAHATLPGHFDISARARLTDPTEAAGSMAVDAAVTAHLQNIDFVKGFLPAETATAFNIPHDITARLKASMLQDVISADLQTDIAGRNTMNLKGTYATSDDAYSVNVELNGLHVNDFVPLDEPLNITADISAKGRGFDFVQSSTHTTADISIAQANYGDIDASNATAHIELTKGQLSCNVDCDNPLLQTNFRLNGEMTDRQIAGTLNIDLPYANLTAMGLVEDSLTIESHGSIALFSDYGNNFRVDADIHRLRLGLQGEHIETDAFKLFAETTPDTTLASLSTGDLMFRFRSPENLFGLLAHAERLTQHAVAQFKERALDINILKADLPDIQLDARAGTANPVSQLLALQGISFSRMQAHVATNPQLGIDASASIYHVKSDSLAIDSVQFTFGQDSTYFAYRLEAGWPQQPSLPAMDVTTQGHIYPSTTEATLRIIASTPDRWQKLLDIDTRFAIADSMLNMAVTSPEPIIAYKRFAVNADNYVRLGKKNKMYADLTLTEQQTNVSIDLQAHPDAALLQDVHAKIKNLDLSDLSDNLSMLPRLDGTFNAVANFQQNYSHEFWVKGNTDVADFSYEDTNIGNLAVKFDYEPMADSLQHVNAVLSRNAEQVATLSGTYNSDAGGYLNADADLTHLPLSLATPFIPDQIVAFDGAIEGHLNVAGSLDKLLVNGELRPDSMTMTSDAYSLNLRFANEPFTITNSNLQFNRYKIYSTNDTPLTINGNIDFADFKDIHIFLGLRATNFPLIDAPRTRKSIVFGKMNGDLFMQIVGNSKDIRMRGMVRILNSTDLTYVMTDTPLSIDYRLDDIVTFVDFSAPVELDEEREIKTFLGTDMQVTLEVEDGAHFHCEFSADRQSYVNVQGGGSIAMNYTPEGVLTMQGRYTVNEGEMKYSLPVIPLKNFTIANGSYIEFTGEPANPTLNFAATEETKATVSDAGGSSRSVTFETGLKVTGTLEEMQLEFTIDAPEDMAVKNELAGMSSEEKNKLAVGLLCTGMYLSGSNSTGFSANNALNNFLQNEINNIAGQALATTVDVNVGMEQSTRDDGTTRTDYSFKFSKRFFSNRLNVIIGGKVNADGNTQENEAGAYIDNVSLEYRLDNGGTRYVRLYHEKNYDNLVEGELIENGASLVLRKKLDKLSDLFLWLRRKDDTPSVPSPSSTKTNDK